MTNRKIKVYDNNQFSFTRPQHNRIPQGSPLLVILFLIAFNKLNLVILKHTVQLLRYADDYHIFKKINKDPQVNIDPSSLISTLGVNTTALPSLIFVKTLLPSSNINYTYPNRLY